MMEGRNFASDRISDLHDSLLTKILSLLPAEEVVRTSALSTRWMRVWASVPVLVFDDYKYDEWQLSDEEFMRRDVKFIAFVEFVLDNREPLPLNTFEFSWSTKFRCNHRYVSKLLRRAVRFKPKVLYIDIYTDIDIFDVPYSIFKCASIEEMSLVVETTDLDDHFIEPKVNLPALNKLELGRLHINDYFIRMLFSGCPALKELVLNRCYLFVDEISSPVLKKLVMKKYLQFTEMQISCPSLVYLEIDSSSNSVAISLKNMPSLVTAHIFFGDVYVSGDPYSHGLMLLGGLSNVTTLELSTCCHDLLFLLGEDIPNCKSLKNLEDLKIGELDVKLDWNLVVCFLQHSPNLKKVTLEFGEPSEVDSEEDPLGDVAFQREYLETVVIIRPWGYDELASEAVKMLETLVKTIGNTSVLVIKY